MKAFLVNTKKAYVECGKYMLKKFPKKALKAASLIDPQMVKSGNLLVFRMFSPIYLLIMFYLRKLDCCSMIPKCRHVSTKLVRRLNVCFGGSRWKRNTMKCIHCVYSQMVTGMLSIFHGPRVESSFGRCHRCPFRSNED